MKPGDNLKGLIAQIKQSLTKGDEKMKARNEAIKQRDDAENRASLCLEEAERHYKSVGKMLAELQDLMPEGNVWKKYVVEQCGISYPRVAKLMQIYSGKTTLKEMRQRKKERMRKVRAKKGTPHKKRGVPRGGRNPPDDEPEDTDEMVWRRGLLFRAETATTGAEFEDWSHFMVDDELIKAAQGASEAWDKCAAYLRRLKNEKAA